MPLGPKDTVGIYTASYTRAGHAPHLYLRVRNRVTNQITGAASFARERTRDHTLSECYLLHI